MCNVQYTVSPELPGSVEKQLFLTVLIDSEIGSVLELAPDWRDMFVESRSEIFGSISYVFDEQISNVVMQENDFTDFILKNQYVFFFIICFSFN